jgi:gluconolactonase
MKILFTASFLLIYTSLIHSCKLVNKDPMFEYESKKSSFRSVVNSSAEGEVICSGFDWSEGPLWLADQKTLLFCDIPKNSIYKWTEAKGKELYLKPSGYTGSTPRGGEVGSNGLILDNSGRLLLCQHGDRRIARMDAPLSKPAPTFTTLADNYNGKKFDSPNDLFIRANGDIFFTDPPYGMEQQEKDPLKEAPYQGIYKLSTDGKVHLLTDTVTRPNGIAMMPDGRTLIVASSDAAKAVWYAFTLDENDSITGGRIFCDATQEAKTQPGLPDGLKIDRAGNIFATGPGGIWVFDKSLELIGKIKIKGITSNCVFADDERTLFITADDNVLRVKMR